MGEASEDYGVDAGRNALRMLYWSIRSCDEYYRWCDLEFSGKHNSIGVELRKRIGQLCWVLDRVLLLLAEAATHGALTTPQISNDNISNDVELTAAVEMWRASMPEREIQALFRRGSELSNELELMVETFYWIGARTRSAIRQLPGLDNFEAKGIRDVRNKLLEHSEGKDSGVLITSFGYGAPKGPVLKALRYKDQVGVWEDKGLFINAEEFGRNFGAAVDKAMVRPG